MDLSDYYVNGVNGIQKRTIELVKKKKRRNKRAKKKAHAIHRFLVELKRLLISTKPYCHYCNILLSYKEATFDHLLPKSRGGATSKDNLVLCCEKCNRAKGSKTEAEYRATL